MYFHTVTKQVHKFLRITLEDWTNNNDEPASTIKNTHEKQGREREQEEGRSEGMEEGSHWKDASKRSPRAFLVSSPATDHPYNVDEPASITEYNRIALRVMKELDVPVNDLPAALGDADEMARLHDAGGIHFTPQGSRRLAEAVASFVADYLPETSQPATAPATQALEIGKPQQK